MTFGANPTTLLLKLKVLIDKLVNLNTPRATVVGTAELGEIRALLTPLTSNIRMLDKTYNVITVDNLKSYLKINTISEELYESQVHDCDNFAIETLADTDEWVKKSAFTVFKETQHWVPGCTVGIVLGRTVDGGPHAWNCFVDVENECVYYFEPQSDTFFLPSTEEEWEIII